MKKQLWSLIAVVGLSLACVSPRPDGTRGTMTAEPGGAGDAEITEDLQRRIAQLPYTPIDYDRSLLDATDKRVVAKLVEASRFIDEIFLRQVSEENPGLRKRLVELSRTSPQHRAALQYFDIMKGRWDRLKEDDPFIGPMGEGGKKAEGAGFYPAGMKKEEVEQWLATHPEQKEALQGLFTVVRREGAGLKLVPYSIEYRDLLVPAAEKLREAAAITKNASLRDYLTKRAEAFLTDDYYASDIAWMDLDSPIEVVIGPYEVYEDGMFNYKAAFESFVTVVDQGESAKLSIYASHLPAMEQNLPLPEEHKNPNRGTDSPIKVVQEIFTAGDARRGVQTAAFNLPNDERVRESKGSKKVLLKNVMEAKFAKIGKPIAMRVLDPSQQSLVTFDAFFNHVLFHELSHALGPGIITGADGKRVEGRLLLKNTYSPTEEAKADVLGDWNLFYAMDKGLLTTFDEKTLAATTVGLMFRSMRFGIDEAHGRGNAVQWNWYREKGAIVPAAEGRFKVDFDQIREAVRSLAAEILMIHATGDFDRATRLLEKYGKKTPEIEAVIARLTDLPVDITPVFKGAGEKMP